MNSILLAEDDPMLSRMLPRTLQRFGYAVELASTVEAAQELAERTPFNAILVDLNLGSTASDQPSGTNTTNLARQLQAAQINAPILMFSVLKDELDEMASLDTGVDEYIMKTISVPRLLARLQANIRRHDLNCTRSPFAASCIDAAQFKLDRERQRSSGFHRGPNNIR